MRRVTKTREFLGEAVELVRMQLPPELRDVQVIGPAASLVKLHYGDPKVHYEVWVRRRAASVEVGLHFEGPAETNSMFLEQLAGPYSDALVSLGPEVEPEQWTASWTRVHQELPLTTLDEDMLMVVSGRLSQMVRVLEPLVRQIKAAAAIT